MKYVSLLLFFFVFVLSGCEHEDFLDGFDRDALFAPPTQQELDRVKADWQSRDLSVKDYSVVQTVQGLPGNCTLKVISFTVRGLKEYAMLLVPESVGKVPVRFFIGGFSLENPVTSVSLVFDETTFAGNPFILAIPALRGQSLQVRINGMEYTSPVSDGKHCEAFDGAADDGLALLNVVEATEPLADVNASSVRGGSRGATVALLMAERDERIKKAVAVAGPFNLQELTSQHENDPTYQCQFLNALKQGVHTVSESRLTMIASSPLFFAGDLPYVQVHMAAQDEIVPVAQATELEQEMNRIGAGDRLQVFVYANRDHANIANDNQEMNARIEAFLVQP